MVARATVIAVINILIADSLHSMAWSQTAAEQNAAVWYQNAIDQVEALQSQAPDVFNWMAEYEPGAAPSAQLRAALQQAQPIIDAMRRGAMQEYCDFGLDYDQGFAMLLPHLGAMRQAARLMHADAMVRLHDGDASAAAGQLADLYRVSGHFTDDRTLISSLVGQAVFQLTDNAVQLAVDRGDLDAAASATLIEGLNRLDRQDPFGYVEALVGEQEVIVASLRKDLGNPEALAETFGLIEPGAVDDDLDNPLLWMSPEQLEHEIDLYDRMMGRMVEVFTMPDREEAMEEMKAIEADIERMAAQSMIGGEGLLVGMLMPALGRILQQRDRAEDALSSRLDSLAPLAAGAVKPEELANAALWYLRGVEALEALDAELMNEMRDFAADTSAPLSDELAAFLAGPAQAVIEIFRQGSTKRRCDFSMTRRDHLGAAPVFVPAYAPGMHDALRLLRADAVRVLRMDEMWDGVDRFATGLRISGHLSGDPVIVSAMIAHHDFNAAVSLIETGLTNGMLDETVKPMLMDALERGPRRDPFGYIHAVVTTREELAKRVIRQRWPLSSEVEPHKRERFGAAIKSLGGDQLLYLLAVMEAIRRDQTAAAERASWGDVPPPQAAEPKPDPNAPLARLADVISLPDLHAAEQDSPQIGEKLAIGRLDFFDEAPIPAIAASSLGQTLADHIRRARNDLRRAHHLLRVDVAPEPQSPAVD